LVGWVQQNIGYRASSVGDVQCSLNAWVQQYIGEIAWSVLDGKGRLDGWVQEQKCDSA